MRMWLTLFRFHTYTDSTNELYLWCCTLTVDDENKDEDQLDIELCHVEWVFTSWRRKNNSRHQERYSLVRIWRSLTILVGDDYWSKNKSTTMMMMTSTVAITYLTDLHSKCFFPPFSLSLSLSASLLLLLLLRLSIALLEFFSLDFVGWNRRKKKNYSIGGFFFFFCHWAEKKRSNRKWMV